jgi:soluble lytic murein transglycosylase-like protein
LVKSALRKTFSKSATSGSLFFLRGFFVVMATLGLHLQPAMAVDAGFDVLPPEFSHEAPRIRSMLEHGWAAEKGIGQAPNAALAASLYCEAAKFSSAEAHYRAGVIYASGPLADAATAAAFFRFSLELGREQAHTVLNALHLRAGIQKAVVPSCLTDDEEQLSATRNQAALKTPLFNFQGYIAAMSVEKRGVAALLIKHAPSFGVNTQLALAIAGVESNFDALATSPKNAKGVMQLIPATATRFRVQNPYDAEDNIRGGLAYLRWLSDYFRGDLTRVIAAYNAGEGAVMKYNGVPPYQETRAYLKRVLILAGMAALP